MPLTCRSPTPSAPTRWSVSRFGRTRSARPPAVTRNVFRTFVLCRRLDLYGRELLAVEGTRIKAVNNKDRQGGEDGQPVLARGHYHRRSWPPRRLCHRHLSQHAHSSTGALPRITKAPQNTQNATTGPTNI